MNAAPATAQPRSIRALLVQLAKFLFVGGAAFFVEVLTFNLLRYGPGQLLADSPLTAKFVAGAIAMVMAFLANRQWTFAGNKTHSRTREFALYTLVNIAGILVSVGTLWFSHYVLGLTSPLADNISGNVVGIALGTGVRYLGYRWFVFTGVSEQEAAEESPDPVERAVAHAAESRHRDVTDGPHAG